MEQNLKSYIEELISEIQNELDEATVSGDIAGYNVPGAFSNGGSNDKKRKKKISTMFGMKLVGKIDEGMFSTLDQIKKDSVDLKSFIKNIFSDKQFKDVKSDKDFHKYLKSFYNESVSESVNEAMVSPKNGHQFFQLTKDTPIKFIKSQSGMNAPGVFLHNKDGFIKGKKDAYLIDYFGAAFYVDLKNKFASKIYPMKDQTDLRYNSNFKETDKAPEMSDWKKFLKESVNESIITEKQLKGLDGIDSKTPLTKISDTQKLNIIQGTGNNISFKVPKGFNRNFWQVFSKGKIKKKKSLSGDIVYYLPGKFIDSPNFKSEKDLINGVDWESVERTRRFNESVNEAKVKRPVNRWLELKNDDTMHPHKKMAHGLKELKYQLAETEKFFTWYNKIKTMNELESSNYWKRTQSHIYKIKERLVNIARTIQEIEK
jgi:hypothetical protein